MIAVISLSHRSLSTASAVDGDSVETFLTATFGLRPAELRELAENRPISRTLETADAREIATIGAIRIRVPAAFYIEQLRDVVSFKKSESVPQIGTFGTPARLEDIRDLTLEASDLEALGRCRTGSCGVQLSSAALQKFQQEAPWRSPDPAAAANRIMRAVLVDMVNAYRESGDAALMTYVDAKQPVSVADEFRAMIGSRPSMLERFPLLHQHLLQFPRTADSDVQDMIYWSKEQLGPRGVVSVTHLAIARLSDSAPAMFAVASRQIYGSHYFDASLGLTVLLRDNASHAPASYLLYVNRSRLDALGGIFGGLKGAMVRSRTRSAMSNSLIEARDRVEKRFRAEPRRPAE
ncbi:MAG: hypothetical protein ABJA98_05060 [Acidobacteriota bacterium]